MRPTLLATTLKGLIQKKRYTHIEGSPGLGKTAVPRQVCADLGIGLILIHAPTLQPEDLGLPSANADKTRLKFLLTERFPVVGDDGPDEGVILIDELPQAANDIQKTMAHLVQEHDLLGHPIKPGWSFVSTGNRQSDRAGANRILSHLSNRCTRLEFEPHLDDWCAWALDNGVRPEIVQFLRFKPGLLADFNPQMDSNPTPRAWVEGVSEIIDAVPAESEYECIKGAVGDGAAREFVAFLKIYRKLPDPDAVLLDPKNAKVPDDPATLYAISGAVAHRATQVNAEAVLTYARRLPPEFTVLVVRDAVKKDPSFTQTRAFIDWVSKEGQHIIL